MSRTSWLWFVAACGPFTIPTVSLRAEERVERFDQDPKWDGHNNRAPSPGPMTIRQDFGYSRTSHSGGKPGEIGGFICPAAEPAYYAKAIRMSGFNRKLTASGTLVSSDRPYHALLGFFNAGTLNEWRTPNTIAIRISGRGDRFYAWVEYATARWRAGGDEPRSFAKRYNPSTGRDEFIGFPTKGVIHYWSLTYEPSDDGVGGLITATIDDQTAVCRLLDGHRSDGATFNRFGLLNVMKSGDSGGEVWLDDISINGVQDDLSTDPDWDQFQNRRTYVSTQVRPRFDFGFSPTKYAEGRGEGELGGVVFRGDCRYPEKMAYYGDRIGPLDLNRPLKASGRITLRRGVSDSTVLLGFFHSRDSLAANPSQSSGLPASFLGLAVEGPSRIGFTVYPAYRGRGTLQGNAPADQAPVIHPDSSTHSWSLEYDPSGAGGQGRITLTLEDKTVGLDLEKGARDAGAKFDRFGIVTTWIDGNGETIYFDDLTYTSK